MDPPVLTRGDPLDAQSFVRIPRNICSGSLKLLAMALWVCGREARECGQPVGNGSCPPGCPHGPKGSGWSVGLVHISTRCGHTDIGDGSVVVGLVVDCERSQAQQKAARGLAYAPPCPTTQRAQAQGAWSRSRLLPRIIDSAQSRSLRMDTVCARNRIKVSWSSIRCVGARQKLLLLACRSRSI